MERRSKPRRVCHHQLAIVTSRNLKPNRRSSCVVEPNQVVSSLSSLLVLLLVTRFFWVISLVVLENCKLCSKVLKHGIPFIKEATQKRQKKEHFMCIKENDSSQSFQRHLTGSYTPFRYLQLRYVIISLLAFLKDKGKTR